MYIYLILVRHTVYVEFLWSGHVQGGLKLEGRTVRRSNPCQINQNSSLQHFHRKRWHTHSQECCNAFVQVEFRDDKEYRGYLYVHMYLGVGQEGQVSGSLQKRERGCRNTPAGT